MSEQPLRIARGAMATRFEIALFGDDPIALRAAAEEALDEVQRVEQLLSWRKSTSPVARLNAGAAGVPIKVTPELFSFVRRCHELWELGNHAFDITVGPLMQAWSGLAERGQTTDEPALAAARDACGMQHVELNPKDYTVKFARPGMRLDFGAVGKGYALDLATEVLRDAGVTSALIHGGTSTVCAIGHPPDAGHWRVAVEYPPGDEVVESLPVLTVVDLCDEAMSVSAVWGRVFRIGQDTFGHVLDPRTGRPAGEALLSIYVCREATEADAMSTALLTEGASGVGHFETSRPDARTLVLGGRRESGNYSIAAHGIGWRPLAC
ncbi:MAG TPA: FAD:protein FMN transferase [Verrucomicrobiales bacterium]|nr:FAD:protein FMN transferase [Verrucomicrobiales bacterium]